VGADGVNGIVAQNLGIRNRWDPQHVALCIAADVPVSSMEIEKMMSLKDSPGELAIELYLGLLRWGYGWCFPKRDEISIGIGCRMDYIKRLQNHWKKFVSLIESNKEMHLDTSGWSAWRVPIGDPLCRKTARRTMLVGDAAGLVSSITGEGINYAIESGIIAADVAIETVAIKNPLHVKEYEERIASRIGEDLRIAWSIAELLHRSPENIELVLEMTAKDTVLQRLVTDMLLNQKPYSELKRKIIKRLLLRHPLMAIKLGRA
jgi:flavin-dependent dehydrogenase